MHGVFVINAVEMGLVGKAVLHPKIDEKKRKIGQKRRKVKVDPHEKLEVTVLVPE